MENVDGGLNTGNRRNRAVFTVISGPEIDSKTYVDTIPNGHDASFAVVPANNSRDKDTISTQLREFVPTTPIDVERLHRRATQSHVLLDSTSAHVTRRGLELDSK